jgi:pimeloyl-ACP methyl ester carboxylesterase
MRVIETTVYGAGTLPVGIRSRFVDGVNGLAMHVLEAGFEKGDRPCILLLHGFPELAYSWRKIMLPLASEGYHVIAPDQRGYGRTTGWDGDYDGDVSSFRLSNLVRDCVALVSAFGYRAAVSVVGHDFGSPVAAYCALARPDVFRSVALMSAPFAGPPASPSANCDTVVERSATDTETRVDIHEALAALERPRKHYQWYYSTREANSDMRNCPQGIHAFLRDYFHFKSADWSGNKPFALESWTAAELARLPTYYIMDLHMDMAQTVALEGPSSAEAADCRWLTEEELRIYSAEYSRTGFQGGLQWYRCRTDARLAADVQLYAGRTIDVPACFIAGKSDWGVYQAPGDFESMQTRACTHMLGCHLLEGAGHWVQQEQPEAVVERLLTFLEEGARVTSSDER